tara:strand:+ start:32 stop:220 length:189 start_codon:yes stop_codon:yes gene_type:complete
VPNLQRVITNHRIATLVMVVNPIKDVSNNCLKRNNFKISKVKFKRITRLVQSGKYFGLQIKM